MEPTAPDWCREPEGSSRLERTDRDNRPSSGIRHVLVPLDGSELAKCVLPFAAVVAHAFGARITLLRVLEPVGDSTVSSHVDPLLWQISQAAARSELNAIASELERAGATARVEIVSGIAAEQIIRVAEEEHVDLIALSSHGERGLSGWLLSSTVQKVALRAPTSILIVPGYACSGQRIGSLRLARILLPLDCSPRAECTLPVARALARADDAELVLAHVVSEIELPRRMSSSAADLALAAQLTERNRAEAEHYLSDLQRQVVADGTRARGRIVVAPRCARTLRALADEEHVDLLVLCAHGATGYAGERYGTVAARLLQSSNRPMLIVQDLTEFRCVVNPAEAAAHEHAGH
jgi:nucleotide-binding universal stress UspA family protein